MKRLLLLAPLALLASCGIELTQTVSLSTGLNCDKYDAQSAPVCQAMKAVLDSTSQRPLHPILPGNAADIYAMSGETANTFATSSRGRAYAMANIFTSAMPYNSTQTLKTLDGKAHTVTCDATICTIDGTLKVASASGTNKVISDGTLYAAQPGSTTTFLPF